MARKSRRRSRQHFSTSIQLSLSHRIASIGKSTGSLSSFLLTLTVVHRFMNVVKDLRQRLTSGSPSIPSWIHVVPASIPDIIKSLDYWINESPRKTTKRMLDHHDDAIYQTTLARMKAQAASGGFTAYGGHDPFGGQAGAIQSMIDQQSDEEIIRYGTRMMNADGTFPTVPTDPAARAEFIKNTRKLLAEVMGEAQDEYGMQDSGVTLREKRFYKTARAFIPPPELRKRHPLMAKAWEVSQDRNLKAEVCGSSSSYDI